MANRGGIPRPGLPKDKRSSWIHPKFIVIVFHAVARVHDTLEGDMMDPDHLVTDEAAERWRARQRQRELKRSAIDAGRISEVESPERIKKRLDRLTEATLKRLV